MTTQERAIPAPAPNPENQPYFDACARDTLLVGKCDACGEYHFYPRRICPHCLSDQVQWVAARGTGTIYTYSTMHRGVPVPYTIAYVTLDEGVSMMTNIVGFAPGTLRIGQKVRVQFRATEGGIKVPVFAPA
ncbi:MAG: OB-fold domain-containing protein [Burkholderiales bacterium]|nr:OB-fold domain-containing protein [Burkholderiales bacterium]